MKTTAYASEIQALEGEIANLRAQQTRTDQWVVALGAKVVATLKAEELLSHPDGPSLGVSTVELAQCLASRPSSGRLVDIVTQWTDFSRASVRATAEGIVTKSPAIESHEYRCARAVLKLSHYPLIVGLLPLPPAGRHVRVSMSTTAVYVRVENRLSPAHAKVLGARFRGNGWRAHVQHMLQMRPVVAIDLYGDRAGRDHLGSAVVSKYLARSHGRVYPIVCIESMASVVDGSGTGTMLFALARALLFTDASDVPHGGIVAQCISSVPFWDDLLDATADAQALMKQLHMLYPSFEYEEFCTMRHKIYSNAIATQDTPSPVKVLA